MPLISLKYVIDCLLRPSNHQETRAQAIRQALSGAVVSGADLVAFQASLWTGRSISTAAVISFFFAVAANYLLGRFYVFGEVDQQKHLAGTQFIMYILAALVSLGLIQLVLLILAVHLGFIPILAKILALPLVFIWTLWAGKNLIFNKRVSK